MSNRTSLDEVREVRRAAYKQYKAFKEPWELVSQTESFPFRIWRQAAASNGTRLRSGNVSRVRPESERTRSSPSPAPPESAAPKWTRTVRGEGKRSKIMPDQTRVRRGRVSRRWPAVNYSRATGFRNHAQFCYRLAMLQCLLATPVFYNFLGNVHFKCNVASPDCIVCSLQELGRAYWMQRIAGKSVDRRLQGLESAFTTECTGDHLFREFCVGSSPPQGDPMEFWGVICDELRKKEEPFTRIRDGRFGRFDRMLQVKYQVDGTCDKCGLVVEMKDEADDFIPVSITDDKGKPNGNSVMQNLRNFYDEDSAMVACEACAERNTLDKDGNSRRTIKRSITQAPDMLVVQLKIFNNFRKKLQVDVPFLEALDLSEFAVEEDEVMQYQLHGIVGHAGGSIGSGHYVAAVRSRSVEKKGWVVINDNEVGSLRDFADAREYMVQNYQPYVLIYQKMDA